MPPATLPLLSPAALAFALLSAVLFAGLDLSQKWSSRYAVPTPAGFLALRLLSGALLSPLLLLFPGSLTGHSIFWGPLLGLIACNLLGNILYLSIIYKADVSVVGSLWPLKNVYLLLLAWLLGHKTFPAIAYVLIGVSVVGAILVAWNGKLRLQAFRETPVVLMALVAVPIFALSDYFLSLCIGPLGSPLTTWLTATAVALIAVPPILMHAPTRQVIRESVGNKRGLWGALLTGMFLTSGVACIGQAFGIAYQTAGASGAVLVNVFAMTSGVALLGVTVARPGWLESQSRGTYTIRFLGAILLIAAAGWLFQLKQVVG